MTPKTPSVGTLQLINVSVLKIIGTSLTVGFVIGGSTGQTVLIRAIGPTLSGFGVGGTTGTALVEVYEVP